MNLAFGKNQGHYQLTVLMPTVTDRRFQIALTANLLKCLSTLINTKSIISNEKTYLTKVTIGN